MTPARLEPIIAAKLQTLSETEQRQFRSLHNHFDDDKYPLCGIVKTNCLPHGTDHNRKPSTIVVYPTISLINHSCRPNTNISWNPDISQETLHALRLIPEGEEITLCYLDEAVSHERRAELHRSWGFACDCSACLASPDEVMESDARLVWIKQLEDIAEDLEMIRTDPKTCLSSCKLLLALLQLEHGESGAALRARTYVDAFKICITHADQARAAVFAEYAYEALAVCEGHDGFSVGRMRGLKEDPETHACFGGGGLDWASEKTARPEGLGEVEFERWLWREQEVD